MPSRNHLKTRPSRVRLASAVAILTAAAVCGWLVLRRGEPRRLASVVPTTPTSFAGPSTSSPRLAPPLRPDHPRFEPRPSAPHPIAPAVLAIGAPTEASDNRAAALLLLANEALNREDYAAALRAAQQCLEVDPSSRECFDAELSIYGRTGDFDDERVLAEECLHEAPNDQSCLESIVVVEARQKDLAPARVHALLLCQLAPESTSCALADAVISDASGYRLAAIAAYERACRLGQEFACFRAKALRGAAAVPEGRP